MVEVQKDVTRATTYMQGKRAKVWKMEDVAKEGLKKGYNVIQCVKLVLFDGCGQYTM